MLKRGLPEPLTRSSFVPSSVHLVVILPPSGGPPPTPSSFAGVPRSVPRYARAAACFWPF